MSTITSPRSSSCLLATLLLVMTGAYAESPSVLRIEFGAAPRISSDGVPASLAVRDLEDITGSSRDKCVLAIGEGATRRHPRDESLINISSNRELGFAKQKNWIGIRPNSRGVDCGRVNQGESITFGLGTSIPEKKLIASATFGLSLKGDVHIDIEAATGGGNTDHYEVRSGSSVVPDQGSATGEDGIFNCSDRVDSGPDNDPACEITIDQGFYDAFTLTTRNDGEWSLGIGTTTFQLVEALDCGETLSADFPEGDGVVTLTRLSNTDGPESCTAIPATLRWIAEQNANTFEFLADYGNQTTASFLWEVIWPEEDLSESIQRPIHEPVPPHFADTFTSLIQPTRQRFLADDNQFYIDTCRGTRGFDNGNFVSLTPDESEQFPDLSSASGIQYACWLTRSIEHRDGDRIQVRETGYLQGDWVATRTLR